MNRYRVHIRGNNLLFNVDGELRRCGFTAARSLQAESAETAARAVLIQTHQSPAIRDQQVEEGGPGTRIEVESVEEIGWLAWWKEKGRTGFEFFSQEEKLAEPA